MKIVVDTNVMISGIFFGGFPQKVLRAIVANEITACATTEIIDEYEEIVLHCSFFAHSHFSDVSPECD